jgi:REP element-mobilizing transposase RayT
MAEWCSHWNVAVWAFGLMPNHVHLIAVPHSEDGLRQAIGEAHRRDTRRVFIGFSSAHPNTLLEKGRGHDPRWSPLRNFNSKWD